MNKKTNKEKYTLQSVHDGTISEGLWYRSAKHQCTGKAFQIFQIWGQIMVGLWIPDTNTVIHVKDTDLSPVDMHTQVTDEHYVSYVAAAGRIADAFCQGHDNAGGEVGVLLAPIESAVIPLPHQVRALSRAMSHDRVRYLLADEVGLGKTIEAGLIMRELKLRGRVIRTLVVAPKGLVTQWVTEMRTHFNEHFHLVLSEDFRSLRRLTALQTPTHNPQPTPLNLEPGTLNLEPGTMNPWTLFSQVIVPMDSVKPAEGRGTAAAQERFECLISAGWDLVIVDEAHRLGGNTDQVARFKLGQGLAEAAPYLLLLSATPHQGKTDAFHRLLSLVDGEAFPDEASVTRERVAPYVIRNEKRRAIDADGQPLFKPRRTQLAAVSWASRHHDQQCLYEAVTEYVREGYNQALRDKRSYVGFLMILMQRLVVSSTRAIKTTLTRRLEVLSSGAGVPGLFDEPENLNQEAEAFYDLDGQEQTDTLLTVHLKALKNERDEVSLLLEAAVRCEQAGPDAKAEALLEWLYRLQSEEGEPDLKVLVFTEFVPTQEMLREFLTNRGFQVVCLNGSMTMEERARVQKAFAGEIRILLSTDAGGEGLNLQFCHVVINYDIPWNPMRLEQRIGRVDRIGQSKAVRAVNFVFENSVEHRVREVLEQKLAIIYDEFGIDKTGDVLDSAQAGPLFDEMYVEAILHPDRVPYSVESALDRLKDQVRETTAAYAVLGGAETLDPGDAHRMLSHPMPHWVEHMTVNYLRGHGGRAEHKGQLWHLVWPDGETWERAVFTAREAERHPAARHVTLETPRIRNLVLQPPQFVPGQSIPIVYITGVSSEITGYWSLWQISLIGAASQAATTSNRRLTPLFVADNGAVYTPTARHIWDRLVQEPPEIGTTMDGENAVAAFEQMQAAAEREGRILYDALMREQQDRNAQDREKAEYAFAARRRMIERTGLPEVRNYRLNQLTCEEKASRVRIEQGAEVFPELKALILLRVEGNK